MSEITVSDLRANLRKAIERVEAGETLEVTRDGRVAAVLVHPSVLRRRARTEAMQQADALGERLQAARERGIDFSKPGLSNEYAEELVRWIREARDRHR